MNHLLPKSSKSWHIWVAMKIFDPNHQQESLFIKSSKTLHSLVTITTFSPNRQQNHFLSKFSDMYLTFLGWQESMFAKIVEFMAFLGDKNHFLLIFLNSWRSLVLRDIFCWQYCWNRGITSLNGQISSVLSKSLHFLLPRDTFANVFKIIAFLGFH